MKTEPGSGLWIPANWAAPARVFAGITTRLGGVSHSPFNDLNLAAHVGDHPDSVRENRRRVKKALDLPSEPVWLNQIHGCSIIKGKPVAKPATADGCYTDQTGIVCTVMTADCIPLLLCNRSATEIAAVHVGWRGIGAGIIPAALASFRENAANLLAWIGPHIGSNHYEVGDEVRVACISVDHDTAGGFIRNNAGRWQASLEEIARIVLINNGLTSIYSDGRCTFTEDHYFYSYRREKRTGRMASLIWMAKTNN